MSENDRLTTSKKNGNTTEIEDAPEKTNEEVSVVQKIAFFLKETIRVFLT